MTEPTCVHRWWLRTPKPGQKTVRGTCIKHQYREVREFPAYFDGGFNETALMPSRAKEGRL